MKSLLVYLLMAVALELPIQAATNALENFTLEQAMAMAESIHPQLAEARARIEASAGRARQAGAYPNPEAIAGAQQIPLGGNQGNEREYVAGIGQSIPLGRRLNKAREAEFLDREFQARSLEVKRREIRKRVQDAFATALFQEKAWQAQNEIRQNLEQAVKTAHARLEAGDALREDLARVEIELARAKVELRRAESLREQSIASLASSLGSPQLVIKSLAGTLEGTFELPALASLAANLSAQPESRMADAEVRARAARVETAKAERIPDVKVELLYHRLEASGADTADVGFSIPLPFFNRNQGKIREARAELAAAEARSLITRNELDTRLRGAYLQLDAALAGNRAYKTEILAKYESVLQAAETRYSAGDMSLSEILPVRRDWAALQISYLESLREVMQAWNEVKLFADVR